ncbi:MULTISPECIES: hypothetical protein [Halochromatium]|nr:MULTISPECIES: hypothetical protein [Halochromatium]
MINENLYLGHERKPMNRPTQLEQVKEKLTHLPSDRLIEVNDFIDFLQQRDRDRSLRQAYTRASEHAFREVWDNDEDAAYDNL